MVGQEYPRERLAVTVIAYNCSDDTAERARSAGADVLVRDSPEQPGKPRALAWAFERIPLERYDAVVIVDADTIAEPGFAAAWSTVAGLRDCAAQGYLATLNEYDNWLTRLGGLFARARYEVHHPARERAGINVPLAGNGMCLGAGLLSRGGWHEYSLTEDLELYARLTVEGVPIRYVRAAKVSAEEARTLRQGGGQRQRWAAGRSQVFGAYALPILRSPALGVLQKVDFILELGMPSPMLRLALAGGVAAASLAWASSPLRWVGLVVAIAFVAPDIWAVGRSLAIHPQPLRSLASIIVVPWYALWRLWTGLRATFARDNQGWQKTRRNAP